MNTRIVILAILGLVSSAISRADVTAVGFQPLGIHQVSRAEFPLTQFGPVNSGGRATIVISVDANGTLVDTLTTFYTHPAFAKAALDAIHLWRFDPARLNGRPVGVTKKIDFNFERHGFVYTSLDLNDYNDRVIERDRPEPSSYRAYNVGELDKQPNPVHVVSPRYPSRLAASGVGGAVTVTYFIDEQGRVRVPAVPSEADPELTELVVYALSQWEFDPPTRGGRAVLARVNQVFRFNPTSRS
jgi:TonB family protein